jgi:hypothetical protein
MQAPETPLLLTRRTLFLLTGAGVAAWAASGDFWNKKPPADWTPEEVDKLLSKSPWAKEVTATATRQQGGYGQQSPNGGQYPGGGGGGYPGGGMGMPRIGGMGGGRRGGQRPGAGQGAGMGMKGSVRWESAKPILEASKMKLPEHMDHHYIIRVDGFPAGQEDIDEMKQAATLQPKNKEIAGCAAVEKNGSTSSWFFGFSKDTITLSPDDKEVDFMARIGRYLVKAKFNLKDMLYHGELAV